MRRAWILLFPLVLLAALGCCGPRIKIQTIPIGPDEPVQYQSWVKWTHPESGREYRIPQVLDQALKPHIWAVIPATYKEQIKADMGDLIREQAWIRAAEESRKELEGDDAHD